MTDYDESHNNIETLLEEVIENQRLQHRTLGELHEKIQNIELQLGSAVPEDEYALEEAVDALYDKAYACAETGVHVSVPYLIRELQTNAAVAHELMERLRIDGVLDAAGRNADDDDEDDTDVFTIIDLKEINGDATSDETQSASASDVFAAARAYVVKEQVCSQAALMKALGISQAATRSVLAELEAAGVVSEARGRKGREVLVSA